MRRSRNSILEQAHRELKWPSPKEMVRPRGAGQRVLAELARRKLQGVLSLMAPGAHVTVGILSRDPRDEGTVCPLAVVCEFSRAVSNATLREAHKLSWNFSRAPLLVTLEPHQIRAWTCCESPLSDVDESGPEILDLRSDPSTSISLDQQAAQALHWVELISGRFFERHEDRFQRDFCADRLLLKNLTHLHSILVDKQGLPEDVCHDLLARTIFIQFLIDRKDSTGHSALSPAKFAALHAEGILSQTYRNLGDLFNHYEDSYALFRWLNKIFNGDLFPGKGREPEAEWEEERKDVKENHLRTLAKFLSGEMELPKLQGLLWRHYRFDVIPLEFISSIYEEFVTRRRATKKKPAGTVYTPPHLVDYILDGVLPWNDKDWDLRILDPACGSGIFLVKAFQRLIWRWKKAHNRKPSVADLRRILTHNLFGVDCDPHAVRVASFSLYLAMCDEIDPRCYWTQVNFPALRGRTIVAADFFREDIQGYRTHEEGQTFDLVVGNAPWGSQTVGESDLDHWTKEGWEVADKNIGAMFLPKAAALAALHGQVSMLQSSGLLSNASGTAARLRKKFFTSFRVYDITNLSVLRFGLYRGAIGPSCVITFSPQKPDGSPLQYVAPKELKTIDDDLRIVVEPSDVHLVFPDDAIEDPTIWATLTWGGARELAILRRFRGHDTLQSLRSRGIVKKCVGIIRGDRGREDREILGRRILDDVRFPNGTFLFLQASRLPENPDPWVHSKGSTDYSAFELPQLIIKQGWRVRSRRFEAAIVKSRERGIICSQSYASCHLAKEAPGVLEAGCLVLNSSFATFFLALTSGRIANYIPTATVDDLLRVPLPAPDPHLLDGLTDLKGVDSRVREAFGLTDSEWALVEDLFQYTLPDFKGDKNSPGRRSTRDSAKGESFLRSYCEQCFRVLKGGFGADKRISATVFSEAEQPYLSTRLVSIHLDDHADGEVRVQRISSSDLRDRLAELDALLSGRHGGPSSGALHIRTARVYDHVQQQNRRVPTVYLLKPDRRRYWTRSAAMRDADAIAGDIMTWQGDLA